MELSHIVKEIGALQRQVDLLKAAMKRELVQEEIPHGSLELFVCRVDQEQYGLRVDCINEVLPMCRLDSMPEAPPWIAGLLNLRGRMIPIIDVLARIQHHGREAQLDDFIIICQIEDKIFGIVVQEVFKIVGAQASSIQQVAAELPQAPYIQGLIQVEDQTIFLLSLTSLFATSDMPEDIE
jgi:purine-binding chemotaxis protein CheW